MMDWEKQGGSAFPVDTIMTHASACRDGDELARLLRWTSSFGWRFYRSKDYEVNTWFGPHAAGVTVAEIVAARVYEIADAMLARRRK